MEKDLTTTDTTKGGNIRGVATLAGLVGGGALGYAADFGGFGVAYGSVFGAGVGLSAGVKLERCIINNKLKKTAEQEKLKQTMQDYASLFLVLKPEAKADKDMVLIDMLGEALRTAAEENRAVNIREVMETICAQHRCSFESMITHIMRGRKENSHEYNIGGTELTDAIERINGALGDHKRSLRFVSPSTIQGEVDEARKGRAIARALEEARRQYEAMVERY